MEKQIDNLQTSDIKTSAYLLSKNISLIKIVRDNPKKILFCFPKNQKVTRLLEIYWADKASVNPRTIFDKFEYLKDLIHRDYDI